MSVKNKKMRTGLALAGPVFNKTSITKADHFRVPP